MGQTKAIIKIVNLNVVYFLGRPNEVSALKNISLDIYPGEFVIFFGPSGCGKSTLLYSIAGLETNIVGKIFVDSKNISQLKPKEFEEFHQKKIGMIFQAYYLINSLNILDNVVLPQVAIGGAKKEREKKALELLDHFSVKEQANKFPNELSGGQQQRVAISRSLMNDPEIILADEPIGNLDSKSAESVMLLLKELNEKYKKTVVLVTHDPAFLNIAHRVFYMKDGTIIDIKVNEEIGEVSPAEEGRKTGVTISKELELLARSFSGISGTPGNLLIPFKAKQIVSEVLLGMSEEEIGGIERKVENLLITGMEKNSDANLLFEYLDDEVNKGGLGLNKQTARNLVNKIKDIINEIRILEKEDKEYSENKFSQRDDMIEQVRTYLLDSFEIKVNNTSSIKVIDKTIKLRLDDKIDRNQFRKKIDIPLNKGGAGMDKRAAKKVARRLELLILGKYK